MGGANGPDIRENLVIACGPAALGAGPQCSTLGADIERRIFCGRLLAEKILPLLNVNIV